jgi:hypothetical protein
MAMYKRLPSPRALIELSCWLVAGGLVLPVLVGMEGPAALLGIVVSYVISGLAGYWEDQGKDIEIPLPAFGPVQC